MHWRTAVRKTWTSSTVSSRTSTSTPCWMWVSHTIRTSSSAMPKAPTRCRHKPRGGCTHYLANMSPLLTVKRTWYCFLHLLWGQIVLACFIVFSALWQNQHQVVPSDQKPSEWRSAESQRGEGLCLKGQCVALWDGIRYSSPCFHECIITWG